MNKNFLLSVTLCFVLVSLFVSPIPAAASDCECVQYVKNYFGITESIGNAKDTGTWFEKHGFKESDVPQVGSVAVFQYGFPGMTDVNGHVAIVVAVASTTDTWKITIRGANQTSGGSMFPEFGCGNVRNSPLNSYTKTGTASTKVKYYFRRTVSIRSLHQKDSHQRNLYWSIWHGSLDPGTPIVNTYYVDAISQKFSLVKYGTSIYRIISRKTAMCIVPRSSNVNSQLVQKPCAGKNIEKWKIPDTGTIRNVQTGYYAQISLNSSSWQVTDSPSNGSDNQLWKLVVVTP